MIWILHFDVSLTSLISGVLPKGTVAYTQSLRKFSLEMTGLWGVASEALCLFISTFFLSISTSNDAYLRYSIFSVCCSRLGLWVTDISVTQLQQQEIPLQYRCLIGGVQEAFDASFDIIAFGLGLLFPKPVDFIYISICGCFSVTLAVVFVLFGVYIPRRNLDSHHQTC